MGNPLAVAGFQREQGREMGGVSAISNRKVPLLLAMLMFPGRELEHGNSEEESHARELSPSLNQVLFVNIS